jgi:hypothetical protein
MFNEILKRLFILKRLKGQCYTIGSTHFLAERSTFCCFLEIGEVFATLIVHDIDHMTDAVLKPGSSVMPLAEY